MGTTISAGKRLRAKWDAGEAAFGMWAGIPTAFTAELGGVSGYDYVCADLQHGLVDEATMISMFQAVQACPGAGRRAKGRAGGERALPDHARAGRGRGGGDPAPDRQRRRSRPRGGSVSLPAARSALLRPGPSP